MIKTNTKKLAIAGVFCAVAVVGSLFSFPVFGSKCSPVQHMVNILCAVLLGPGYGVGVAFAASLIRNMLSLGSLMAFPGSMFGALVCGLNWRSVWHSDSWWVMCISHCNFIHGNWCSRCCILCIYHSILYFYRSRRHYFSTFNLQFEKSQRPS